MSATNFKSTAAKAITTAAKVVLNVFEYTAFFVLWTVFSALAGITSAFVMTTAAMLGRRYETDRQIKGSNSLARWYVNRRESAYRFATCRYRIAGGDFTINYLMAPRYLIVFAFGSVAVIVALGLMMAPAMAVAVRGSMPRR